MDRGRGDAGQAPERRACGGDSGRGRRPWTKAVALLGLLAAIGACTDAVAQTSAADRRRAEAIAAEAKLLFKQKTYDEAARLFFEAYTIVNSAALLFNAARAYEEAGNVDRAVALFQAYLERADAPGDGKADARRRLEPLLAKKAEQEAARRAEDDRQRQERERAAKAEAERERALQAERDKAAAARLEADRAATRAAQERAASERRAADQAARRGDGARGDGTVTKPAPAARSATWKWVAGGGSAGALVLALVLQGAALGEADDARAMEGQLHSEADKATYLEHAGAARNLQTGAVVSGVVAAGCAGWLAWQLFGAEEAPRAVLVPTGRGAGLVVRF